MMSTSFHIRFDASIAVIPCYDTKIISIMQYQEVVYLFKIGGPAKPCNSGK